MIDYALNFICDNDDNGEYVLSSGKVRKSIALAMLYVKGDYYLKEFVTALKHALELAGSVNEGGSSFESQSEKQNFSSNLFENYQGFDLSFLKGYAVLIP
jgi:hypothetical protein